MKVSDRQLLAYAAGALEPPRQRELELLLQADPALSQRLAQLTQPTESWARGWHTTIPGSWLMPPPGLGELLGTPAPLMGGETRLVRLSWPDTVPADAWVLMLERSAGQWEVVAPLTEEELVRVGQLPLVDGQRQLELGAGPEAERVGAVLVPARWLPDWTLPPDERWVPVLEGCLSQDWPAGTVSVG